MGFCKFYEILTHRKRLQIFSFFFENYKLGDNFSRVIIEILDITEIFEIFGSWLIYEIFFQYIDMFFNISMCVQNIVQNSSSLFIFSNDELRIILKLRYLEIGENLIL